MKSRFGKQVITGLCILAGLWQAATARPAGKLAFFAASHPNIQYVGRIDFSQPERPRFWQPGVYFTTKFTGTYCEVILNDEVLWGKNHNYLEVVVDGRPVRLQTKAATDTIVVADGLKEGTHTLLVCKNTEANIGWLEVVGIRCKQLLKPTSLPLRKIECIGNSITCGASADASQTPCGKGAWQDQHNAYLAYGPTAARALNAQYHLSSVSGIGLMHSCCNLPIIMPQVYDKVSMRDDSIRWNFNNYTPDIVTICLGQNDGVQDSAAFCTNYVAFIKQVRSHYPKADLVLLTSPMADANLKAFMQKTLASVRQTLHKSGDRKVWMYAFAKRYYKGCDSHPNVEEHQEIAGELAAFIKKNLSGKRNSSRYEWRRKMPGSCLPFYSLIAPVMTKKRVRSHHGLSAVWIITSLLFVAQSAAQNAKSGPQAALIDEAATAETKALQKNLFRLSEEHILFGHQHATEYGHGWFGDSNRSDVKSVTGSHPAVVGIDFSGLSGRPEEAIEAYLQQLQKTIADTYNRGSVVTAAWHFSNPVSEGGFYWKDSVSKPAVKYLIPGGAAHEHYKQILSTLARAAHVRGADGKLVPIVFRPYHELDGDWFWWGQPHCTAEEFKTLWRFTVRYLRDSLGLHNFIYAFSPDNRFLSEATYLERYPGDSWVDLLGVDNYGDMGREGHYSLDTAYLKLKIISDYARKRGKLAAFTETGLESLPNPTWWTETLLKTLQRGGLKLCYVLVWRNDAKSATHFYAPFPGQASAPDFVRFFNHPYTLFENDLKNIYH